MILPFSYCKGTLGVPGSVGKSPFKLQDYSPGGSEWQKPPGNIIKKNSKVENHQFNIKLTKPWWHRVAKTTREYNKQIQKWKTTNSKLN